MYQNPSRWLFAGVCALSLFVPAPHAAEPPPPKPRDDTKEVIEAPVKKVVEVPVKRTKKVIEAPVEHLLAVKAAAAAADNPKVEPGKVKWHADFATACVAAEKSGKPVLLFQMMGKLDDKFC